MASESGLEATHVTASYGAPRTLDRQAAPEEDQRADTLLTRLFAEPWTFEFFQAVRLLEL